MVFNPFPPGAVVRRVQITLVYIGPVWFTYICNRDNVKPYMLEIDAGLFKLVTKYIRVLIITDVMLSVKLR
jgi:hypothetical protein